MSDQFATGIRNCELGEATERSKEVLEPTGISIRYCPVCCMPRDFIPLFPLYLYFYLERPSETEDLGVNQAYHQIFCENARKRTGKMRYMTSDIKAQSKTECTFRKQNYSQKSTFLHLD